MKTIFQTSNNLAELSKFLEKWDKNYKIQAEKIELFSKDLVRQWGIQQRQYFIKIFYHSRGHFKDFLWHLGNYAPNKNFKDILLRNIEEEFGEIEKSHEQHYLDFALQEGCDLSNEEISEEHNLEVLKKFNKGHLIWLYAHKNWCSKFSAFSAYERLDSTDYELLSNVLFLDLQREHIFFKIHRQATHFDKTHTSLLNLWNEDRTLVQEAFEFIAESQLEMWRNLSNEVFSLKSSPFKK